MKLEEATRNVEATGIQETNQFSVEMNAASIDILSSKIYSDAFLAIVRELACNAWDAHVAAGNTQTPFEIWFPHELKSEFKIRDYGTGLSHDDVMYLYTTYFGSNKRDTNSMIGGLGLGSKTPYAYTSAFSVRSFYKGTVSEYAAYKNEHGIPTISLVNSEPTDAPNGIEIAVPVTAGDFHQFRNVAQKALEWFPTKPKTHGFELQPVDWETQLESCGMRKAGDRYGSASIVMGNVSYALNMNLLSSHTTFSRGISSMAKSAKFVLFAEIGELTIAASREELNYTEKTIQRLIEKLEAAHKGFVAHISKGIEDETTLAGKFYWRAKLPSELRDAIDVDSVVAMPASIQAKKVDAYTWSHETGIKMTTCSQLELRGDTHPKILICQAKNVPFKKIIESNAEFIPASKGRGGRSYYSSQAASHDIYVLWRPIADPDGSLKKTFDEFLENFDDDYVYSSDAFPQPKRVTVSKQKGTYVKPASRKRKVYKSRQLTGCRDKWGWNETEESLDAFDTTDFVLVGFSAFESKDHDTAENYPLKLTDVANALRNPSHQFLGVPKAAWKTAKKQGFLMLDQYVEQQIEAFKDELTKEEYVLVTQRDSLRRAYPLLVKFMEHTGTWNEFAPDSIVTAICEKFRILGDSYRQRGGMEDRITKVEEYLDAKLFDLTDHEKAMHTKDLQGAEEWLNWAYPYLAKYLQKSSWTKIDEIAGRYINCIEGTEQ